MWQTNKPNGETTKEIKKPVAEWKTINDDAHTSDQRVKL
jgi:hypothetical protein